MCPGDGRGKLGRGFRLWGEAHGQGVELPESNARPSQTRTLRAEGLRGAMSSVPPHSVIESSSIQNHELRLSLTA